MDGPRESHTEWSKSDREGEILYDILYTWNLKRNELEKEMATHSSVLAWRIPGTGEPGGLPSMGSQRVGYDWSALAAAADTCFNPISSVCVFFPLLLRYTSSVSSLWFSTKPLLCIYHPSHGKCRPPRPCTSWLRHPNRSLFLNFLPVDLPPLSSAALT